MRCLDSSFIIDLLRNNKEANLKSLEMDYEFVFTTHINVFEILFGIYKIKNVRYENRIEAFKKLLDRIKILRLDYESTDYSAKIAGNLSVEGRQIDPFDCLIAGIALSNGISKMVTRNSEHFKRIKGLKVETY